MERAVAPRRVVHPRPAPRRDPSPVTAAVGYPADSKRGRIPHRTILGIGSPLPILIQVLCSRNVWIHILPRPNGLVGAAASKRQAAAVYNYPRAIVGVHVYPVEPGILGR